MEGALPPSVRGVPRAAEAVRGGTATGLSLLRSESTEIKTSRAHTHCFEGRAHLVRACEDASGVIMWGMHTKGGTR